MQQIQETSNSHFFHWKKNIEHQAPENVPFVRGDSGIYYRICERIGNGSFGAVYDAKILCPKSDSNTYYDQDVVVKVIDTSNVIYEEI